MADTTVTGRIGDQDVQLVNAASEATLQKLLEAFNRAGGSGLGGGGSSAGDGSGSSGSVSKAATATTTAMNKAGTAVGKFASAIDSATSTVLGFAGELIGGISSNLAKLAKELIKGGDKLSDFTQHLANMPFGLLGVGTALHMLTSMLDGVFETYKNVREVGGIFGNSMIELTRVAAESGMTLTRFGSLVANNAQTIAILGTSVADGAKRFGQLSKTFREGAVGQRLLEMGYTVDGLNETLLDYTNITASSGRLGMMSNRDLTESAGQFALELDRAAAASGVSRKELSKTVLDLSGDMAIQAAAEKLPVAAREKFILDLAQLSKTFPEMSSMILMGVKGVYKDLGPLGSQMTEFIGITERIASGQISAVDAQGELIDSAIIARDRIKKTMSAGQIEMLSQQDPKFKAAFDAITKTAAITKKSLADIAATQAQKDAITATFGKFADLIERFRAKIATALLASTAFNTALNSIEKMFSEGNTELGPILDSIVKGFTVLLIGVNEFVQTVASQGWGAAFKNAFTLLLSSIFLSEKEMLKGNGEWMNNQEKMEAVQAKIKQMLIDGIKALGSAMVDGAVALWKDPEIRNAIIIGLGSLFALFIGGKFLGGLAGGAGQRVAGVGGKASGVAAGGGIEAGLKGLAAGLGAFANPASLIGLTAVTLAIMGIAKAFEIASPGFESFGKMIKSTLEGVAPVVVAFGTAVGTVMKDVGTAITSAKDGFTAIFNGIATVVTSIGSVIIGSITAISDSISKIIDTISNYKTAGTKIATDSVKTLANIPSANMTAAAAGIEAIKKALDGFNPGFLSGISQGLGGLFSGDQTGPLQQMAALGPRLQNAAAGFTAFKTAIDGMKIANLSMTSEQTSSFETLARRLPEFTTTITALGTQAANINATAEAIGAFKQATTGFDLKDFSFSKEQLTSLADGTTKLRQLSEQLRASKDGFQKLDQQGLKNIKDGVESLSKAFKDFNESFTNKFIPKFEELKSKTQEGLMTDIGTKLDTLNSNVTSLITIEDASKKHLDTIASKKAGKIY